jgi:hypothetical protein
VVNATFRWFRREHEGQLLELSARRNGLRTRVELFVDRHLVGEASGVGRVMAPFPVGPDAGSSDRTGSESSQPTVLVLSVLPGT